MLLFLLLIPLTPLWAMSGDSVPEKRSFGQRLYDLVKTFSRVDTSYIEPQHYNFAAMIQNTNTYEIYSLYSKSGQSVTFAPKPSIKFGPYFGWRWIFLGYTLDFSHLGDGNHKQDFNISLYSNQLGLDLFYRKTGNDYKVRTLVLGEGVNTDAMRDVGFDGLSTSIKGFNLYYIFNHHRFSYPAAYSQSTVQRRSCGSWLAGIGYTSHSLQVDWASLSRLMAERLGQETLDKAQIDSSLTVGSVRYRDLAFSAGYAYNWVFARNWLFDVSLSLALGYKHSAGDMDVHKFTLENFSFSNFNLDGVWRLGVVWNNTKWFAGANAIFHTYNYRKSQFYTNNSFGSVNIYVGFNFNKR